MSDLKRNKSPLSLVETVSLIFIAIGILSCLLDMWAFIWPDYATKLKFDIDKMGTMGDAIGGLSGSLWSLAALLLFWAAFRLQTAELRVLRNEYRLSRRAFDDQVKNQILLRFENTYFQMLSNFLSIVNSSEWNLGSRIEHGRACLERLNNTLMRDILDSQKGDKSYCKQYFERHDSLVSPFCNFFESIIEWIANLEDDSNFEAIYETPVKVNKMVNSNFFHGLIFAQMSVSEKNLLLLYFWSCDKTNIYELILKFHKNQNLPWIK